MWILGKVNKLDTSYVSTIFPHDEAGLWGKARGGLWKLPRILSFHIFLFRNPNFSLQPLYNKIKSFATAEQNSGLLLIDDLSSLISIGVRVQEIIDFSHYCSTLMCFSPTVVGY